MHGDTFYFLIHCSIHYIGSHYSYLSHDSETNVSFSLFVFLYFGSRFLIISLLKTGHPANFKEKFKSAVVVFVDTIFINFTT